VEWVVVWTEDQATRLIQVDGQLAFTVRRQFMAVGRRQPTHILKNRRILQLAEATFQDLRRNVTPPPPHFLSEVQAFCIARFW